MSPVELTPLLRRWECPRGCGFRHATRQAAPHAPYHACPQFGGMEVPLVLEGERAKVERTEREDYINGATVRTDDEGRPVMNVKVTTDEGEKLNIFAPVAEVQ